MFQYYRDLKNYDESMKSIFVPHGATVHSALKIKFLKKWDENHCRSNIASWDLQTYDNEEINQEQFVEALKLDMQVIMATYCLILGCNIKK